MNSACFDVAPLCNAQPTKLYGLPQDPSMDFEAGATCMLQQVQPAQLPAVHKLDNGVDLNISILNFKTVFFFIKWPELKDVHISISIW